MANPLHSPAELREVAARARRYAQYVVGDVAESRLLELADQLEARAAELEALEATPLPSCAEA